MSQRKNNIMSKITMPKISYDTKGDEITTPAFLREESHTRIKQLARDPSDANTGLKTGLNEQRYSLATSSQIGMHH